MKRFRLNEKKLRELILYVMEQRPDLKKLPHVCAFLFRIDMEAFARLGKPVTGATYIKMPWGPMPKGLDRVLAKMARAGEIEMARPKPRQPKRRKR